MNTLSRTYTSNFFKTAEDYSALKAHWSKLVNSPRKKELRAEHYLLYLALLGRDYTRAFSPITNQHKLDNGMRRYLGLEQALEAISWPLQLTISKHFDKLAEPFDGLVKREMVVEVNKLLPSYRSLKDPLTAYNEPEAVNAAG